MAVLKSDAFTGTDGTILPTYDANWVTQAGGDLEIHSNAVANNTTGTAVARYHGVTWPNDQYAQATVVAVAGQVQAVTVRNAIGGGVVTYYGGGHNLSEYGHTRYAIWKYSSGVFTNLFAHASQTVTIADVVKLEIQGTTLKLWVNGTEISTDGGITDSGLSSGEAGLALFHGTASVSLWDTFEGGDFVSSTTPVGMFGGN